MEQRKGIVMEDIVSSKPEQILDWLIEWLIEWLIDWLIDWLIG